MAINKTLRGVAGEYLTAGELSKRGYISSITLKNTHGIDILASNSNASRSVGIQVKTTIYPRAKFPSWMVGDKADKFYSDNLFYVFVLLKPDKERSDFYIVPSKDVAKYIEERSGGFVNKFHDKKRKYLERWDLLGLD